MLRSGSVTWHREAVWIALAFLIGAAAAKAGSWAWQNPLPQGNPLWHIWGSSGSDVFAVGDAGTILHYDGHTWSPMISGTTEDLSGVWGSGGSNVFAVGNVGTILHYDGHAWSPMSSGTTLWLVAVWGSSGSDVFAVGWAGTVLHYDGSTWSAMSSGASKYVYLLAVWGSSGSDVIAVGDYGTIVHYDGSSWSTMASGTTADLFGVWGASGSDVFASGRKGTILRRNGSTWVPMSTGVSLDLGASGASWGTSASNVFVTYGNIILHYDGSSWSQMVTGSVLGFYGLWGSSGSDVFAVGNEGAIFHYDGATWSAVGGGIVNWRGAVWGSGAKDVFSVGGQGTILHYDGAKWSSMTTTSYDDLYAVWGSGASDVFAVGNPGTILHYDGSNWSAMSSGTTKYLLGVWGSSGQDVFVVGDAGTILHYDGGAWSAMTSGAGVNLHAVWGTSATNVYAVGGGGTILHYDGTSWSSVTSGTTDWLLGVWGSGANDVFAAGSSSIVHFDGSVWAATKQTTTWIDSVWGSAGNDVYAVGEGGLWMLHFDGSAWSPMATGTKQSLHSVWGSGSSDVFAVGDGGTILHHSAVTGCVSSATTLCIDASPGDRRFKVEVGYQTTQGGGVSGKAQAIPLASLGITAGGLFYFTNATNPEMMIKVLDTCSFDSNYWVFYSAGTNFGLTTTVTDTVTGHSKTYTNPDLTAAPAVQDLAALPCPSPSSASATVREAIRARVADEIATFGAPVRDGTPSVSTHPRGAAASAAPCVPGDTTLCIDDAPGDKRFQVEVSYQTAQSGGLSGSAHSIPLSGLGITAGGIFYFTNATNPEMLLKVLNACGFSSSFWVFYSAGTNFGLTTTVTDTLTGQSKTYTNPDRTAAPPVQDLAALPCP